MFEREKQSTIVCVLYLITCLLPFAGAQTEVIDNYTIPMTLKPGKNSILVKVCEEVGGWGFYLRITDTDGNPFDDLRINETKKRGLAQ